jgi:hypothetical protein
VIEIRALWRFIVAFFEAVRASMDMARTLRIWAYDQQRKTVEFACLDDALDAYQAGLLCVDEHPSTGVSGISLRSHFGANTLWRGDVEALIARRGGRR